MAIYRQLHTTFWKDDFIGECSQIEKLFYLYLISNDKTTQSGAYEFSYRYAQFELGISREEVDRLLDFFVSKGKIRFNKQHNEVLLVNWLKYNSARSPKVAPVIDKELDNLKTVEFKSEVVTNCMKLDYPIKTKLEDLYPIDIVSENETYHIDMILQPEPTQNQHQHITNSSSKKEKLKNSAATSGINPFDFYQQNFGVLAPVVSESINHWVKDIGVELVIEAMSRAVKEQKGFRYSEGIMKNWAKRNILSMEAVKADDAAFQNRQQSYSKSPTRKETLPDWASPENQIYKETPLSPEEEAEMRAKIERLSKPKEQVGG
ncbi:DnaD domain protein [Vagococcus carniphilus]|uniref:DnaD domain-containing protein n=1 Tax=Vagococcus carniphilus TaxID=218144 RepID=UPI00288D0E62|nr:DnaD domain protein [Vagococcus carniphilus]MDT2829739.1 DnaD domain protein [Vagococcus carniphilus]MDT2839198.1 DnaD domain protein [Vagococcus carniphilus]MDT2853256.1 DnaD domain protein [Vagococcus carniphilus]